LTGFYINIEVSCEESVTVVEDFRRGLLAQGGRRRNLKKLTMGGGLNSFFQIVQQLFTMITF
jgi:hypothetical protein